MAATSPDRRPPRRRRNRAYLWVVAAVVVGLGLLFLILGLTVFKPKHPVTTVNSISIADHDFSVDILKRRVLLNFTLDVQVTVENPNGVGFKYTSTTAVLRYRGNDVGDVPIPAGEIGARDARTLNLTLALMADRLLADSDFYSNATSGKLHFQTFIRVSGKVRIVFNIHVVAYSTCDLDIHLPTATISNKTCH
ncbi:hypothetical protein Salat_0309700 [Sesamum alatum]|uniref:Late embryogenesis abundant protein LEA-2 subgroup domain-containing protein n=1 Tax=Sesamum alatum TaxID=300844 RepID=A0AAE1Z1F7_9LAMI|nr:hypothetical protein Salat_0309700 [Sesamum alatum]